ncbi:MAG: dihydrofolate reductase family protein [bacterium]|nr:dihydrofolate reductase family protein [bacterium]
MRELIVRAHLSVDGFVGGPDGAVEWVFDSMDEAAVRDTVATLAGAGTHAMGAVTYRDMAAHWPTSDEAYAPPMNDVPKVVFARSPIDTPWGEVRVAAGDMAEEVRRLKAEPGGYVLAHGGSRFFQALAATGLVDEYRLLVHPVVLGAGLPLFAPQRVPQRLALVGTTRFPCGAIACVYRSA